MTATTRTTVEIIHCPRHGYVVMWFGQAHGLPHVKAEDAEQHAQALRDAEDWDKAQRRGWR